MKKILGLMAFLCLFAFSGKAVLTSYAAPGGSFGDNLTWTLSDNSTLTISGSGRMDDYETNAAQPWFSDQDNIKSVVIEDGVTSIGNYAFANLTSLESVTIGKDAESIGRAAFSECRSLGSVTIPDSVESIGSYAFYKCTSLGSVTIGEGVESIGSFAFDGCTSLGSVTIPESVESIGDVAFYRCTALESVTIPESVKTIEWGLFGECTDLKSVTILAENVTLKKDPDIPDYYATHIFYRCSSLKDVYLAGSKDMWEDFVTYVQGIPNSPDIGSYAGETLPDPEFHYCVSVTAGVNNEDWGSVTGGGMYLDDDGEDPEEADITLKAVPKEGWVFAGWEKDGQIINTDKEWTFTYKDVCDREQDGSYHYSLKLKAIFKKPQLTITVKDQMYAYDGEPHGESDPVYEDKINEKVTIEGLLDGDRVAMIILDGQDREIGTYPGRIEATGVEIKNASDKIVTEKYTVTFVPGDLTIYGTVSFDANGGTGEMEDVLVVKDVYELPECAFTAPGGKTFRCWLVDNEERDPGTEIMMNENKVVTAQWKDKDEPHVHDPKLVEKKEATCTEAGNKTYYKCSCGKWFEDKTALKEITDKSSITIKALGHDWDSGVVTKAPTATKDGIRTYTCRRDSSHTKTETIPATGKNSHSVSGGGSGSGFTRSAAALNAWTQDDAGWHYKENGTFVSDAWRYLSYSGRSYWYYFDESGTMATGWLELKGARYYLCTIEGDWLGHMLTGWNEIEGKWYYFETASGSSEGRMYRNERTPDGYWVGEDGSWDGSPAG